MPNHVIVVFEQLLTSAWDLFEEHSGFFIEARQVQ